MSGTSLDGLDIADVEFIQSENGSWSFELIHSETIDYSNEFKEILSTAHLLKGEDLGLLSVDLGIYYGQEVLSFIERYKINKDLITAVSSHGQTIFHQPDKGFTLQIGNGPELTSVTGIKSIVDFRTKDVSLGGNGAPLVPVADDYLFSHLAESFLNIGGFANISFKKTDWSSFDICPANIVLNNIMKQFGKSFDFNGEMGRISSVNQELLEKLNSMVYYNQNGPKSLGWEWVDKMILPTLDTEKDKMKQLGTYYAHIADQILRSLDKFNIKSVLITGGGALNSYLIDLIKKDFDGNVLLPSREIIDFKEAIAFAFLGLLRLENINNVYASVTGAESDSCSGVIFTP